MLAEPVTRGGGGQISRLPSMATTGIPRRNRPPAWKIFTDVCYVSVQLVLAEMTELPITIGDRGIFQRLSGGHDDLKKTCSARQAAV